MTPTDLPERLARKIVVDAAGCWLWQGCRTSKAGKPTYGMAKFDGRSVYVHRLVYGLLLDPEFPLRTGWDGVQLDHLCLVKHCCNPTHVEPVTNLENTRRHYERGGSNPGQFRPTLSDAVRRNVVALYEIGVSQRAIARQVGIDRGSVGRILATRQESTA